MSEQTEEHEGTLFELWSNLDSYTESWSGLVAEHEQSDFIQGVSYCLDDIRTALAISRRAPMSSGGARAVEARPESADKTADVLIAALHGLVDEWKQLSGLPTPLTFDALKDAGPSARTLWEAAHDLAELLAERTPLSYEDEARADRLRLVALDARTRLDIKDRPTPAAAGEG